MTTLPKRIPDINELYEDSALISKQSELLQLLNCPPKKEWVKQHPTITVKNEQNQSVPLKYLTIQTVEYILTSIFLKWRVEIKETKLIANSVVVMVRLYVQDPITMDWDFQDGVGAAPIQTAQGAGAIEFNQMKSGAIQMAAPAAESYAVKDAAEKFGKIFGKDLNRKENYDIVGQLETRITGKQEVEEIPEALVYIIAEADADGLANILKTNKNLHSNPKFMQLLNNRKKELNANA